MSLIVAIIVRRLMVGAFIDSLRKNGQSKFTSFHYDLTKRGRAL